MFQKSVGSFPIFERQNERLKELAGVIGPDLRNPLQMAHLRLSIARREDEIEHLEVIYRALIRMEAFISEVFTWTREGSEVNDVAPVNLRSVMNQCWENVDTQEGSLAVDSNCRIEAGATRLQ